MSFIPLVQQVNPNSFFFDSANRFNGVSALQQIRAQTLANMEALRASREADDLEFNSRLGARNAFAINEQNRQIRSQFGGDGITDNQLMQAGLLPGPDVQFNAAAFAARNAPTIGNQNVGFGALTARTLAQQQIQANQAGLNTQQALLGRFAPQFSQPAPFIQNPLIPQQNFQNPNPALGFLTQPTTPSFQRSGPPNRSSQFSSSRPVQNVGTTNTRSAQGINLPGAFF